MKLFYRLLATLLLATPTVWAQSGGVGIGTATPHASAALDVNSTTKGLLPPRLTTAERDLIASPAAGLTIFNTSTHLLNVWDGSSWVEYLANTPPGAVPAPVTFAYTGGVQTYVVPPGVFSVQVDMAGAAGGDYASNSHLGGKGGRVLAQLPVVPSQTLYVYVGGAGLNGSSGGYNGGGNADLRVTTGSGGGATDIRRGGTNLAERVLVAGGGGGAGFNNDGGCGGGLQACAGPNSGGSGGTQTAAGVGNNGHGNPGGAGGLGFGGTGNIGGGGGGGGYYGGGGGGGDTGGGGGSSYAAPGALRVVHTAGHQSGNGYVTLSPGPPAPFLDGSNFINVPGDNLGNHTATQNLDLGANQLVGSSGSVRVGNTLDLGANQLVGNGGSSGLSIGSTGNVGIGLTGANYRLQVAGGDTRLAATGAEQSLFGLDRVVGFNDLRFYTDDTGTGTPSLYLSTANGPVGIGTSAPTTGYRTDVKTADAAESGLLVRLTGSSTAQSLKLEHNGSNLIVRPATAGGTSTVVENTAGGGSLLLNPTAGNVGIGSPTPGAKLEVNGFTKLGSNAPAIKTLELTGTFGGSQGQAFVAHGLDPSKIVSLTAMVTVGADYIPPGFTLNSGVLYGVYINLNNVVLQTGNTSSSGNVYGKTARIFITYKE